METGEMTGDRFVEARQALARALAMLAAEYDETVETLARQRQEIHGAEFSVIDLVAGASAVYRLAAESDEADLPWPAKKWVARMMFGEHPLWSDEDAPPKGDAFRQQWLVIAIPPYAESLGLHPGVIASFRDSDEADWFAATCRELKENRSGEHYDYLVVHVPGHDYEDRERFADVWDAVEEEDGSRAS